ncbi:hypothetical protein M407DRAFT_22248 [Tulasnella calospora MUT 4182]|uniref:Uncharacterized protein n=1 Tax=Tulasnella calospora MUT 4182 TaxID=1051891 RepID=A0A0C3QNI0_9AGAM|nr:hypothetical protein M407DRAFT_22248 [Tulasnella calospora MUT 4182]
MVQQYKRTAIDVSKDCHTIGKLKRQVEKAKLTLFSQISTKLEIESFKDGNDFSKTFGLLIDVYPLTIELNAEAWRYSGRAFLRVQPDPTFRTLWNVSHVSQKRHSRPFAFKIEVAVKSNVEAQRHLEEPQILTCCPTSRTTATTTRTRFVKAELGRTPHLPLRRT